MRTRALAAAFLVFAFLACTKREAVESIASKTPALPLERPKGVAYDVWIAGLQEKLPVAARLRESTSSVNLFTTSADARRYRLDIEITNNSGYRIDTGTNLYILETGLDKPDPRVEVEDLEADPDIPLKVAGGYFRTPPPENFSGAAELRPDVKNLSIKERIFFVLQSLDDDNSFGLYNSQSRLPDGTLYRKLGPSTMFASARGGKLVAAGFGGAPKGAKLRIESDLLLLVMVKEEFRSEVVAVSPELQIGDGGNRAAFRYLLTFRRDESRKRAWTLANATLLPMSGDVLLPMTEDPNETLWRRVFAARWSGLYAGRAAMPALQKIATDKKENGALRAAAIASLATVRDPTVFDLAVDFVRTEPKASKPRLAAIALLGSLGDPRASPILLGALPPDDAEIDDFEGTEEFTVVRQAIIHAIGDLNDKSAVDRLLRYLEADDFPEIHADASEALRDIVDETHLSRLRNLARSDVTGAHEGIRLLGAIGTDRAVDVLAEFIAAEEPEIRATTCEALGRIDRPGAVSLLQRALNDREDYVRTSAATALGSVWNPARRNALFEAMDHRDIEVQRIAMSSLAEHLDRDAKKEIMARLRDETTREAVREGAASALGGFSKDEEAKSVLLAALDDSSNAVRMAAVRSLGRIGATDALTMIQSVLDDPDEEVRLAAAEALGTLGAKESGRPLLTAALKEQSEPALMAQVDALIALDYHETSSFDQILARLNEESTRTEMERLLEHITDEDFGVGWDASEDEISESIKAWRTWYAENATRRQ